MEEDARAKRMAFITDSTDIRDMFAWAHPMQVLQAIRVCSTRWMPWLARVTMGPPTIPRRLATAK